MIIFPFVCDQAIKLLFGHILKVIVIQDLLLLPLDWESKVTCLVSSVELLFKSFSLRFVPLPIWNLWCGFFTYHSHTHYGLLTFNYCITNALCWTFLCNAYVFPPCSEGRGCSRTWSTYSKACRFYRWPFCI